MTQSFDIQRARGRSTTRGLPSWSMGSIYDALRKRFTKLARQSGPGMQRVGPFAIARRPSATPAPRGRREPERQATGDPLQHYRQQLKKAFMFAHERGQIGFALTLLEQGLSPTKIERCLSAMPQASRPRGGLAARIAARDAVAAEEQTVIPPNVTAAELIRSYNKALGIQG